MESSAGVNRFWMSVFSGRDVGNVPTNADRKKFPTHPGSSLQFGAVEDVGQTPHSVQ